MVENTKRNTYLPAIGFVAILLSVYGILFAGFNDLDEKEVRARLDNWTAQIEQLAADYKSEAAMRIGNLNIRGFGYDKYGHIDKMSLTFVRQQPIETSSVSFAFSAVELKPDLSDSRRTNLSFISPSYIVSGSDLLAMITTEEPIQAAYGADKTTEDSLFSQYFTFPRHLVLKLNDVGVSQINTKNPSQLSIMMDDKKSVIGKFLAQNLSVKFMENDFKANDITLSYRRIKLPEKLHQSRISLAVNNITLAAAAHALPLTFSTGFTLNDNQNDETRLAFDKLLVTDGSFKINLSGDLIFSDNALAKTKEMSVEISEPEALLASGWIAPNRKGLARKIIQTITGENSQGKRTIAFDITRDAEGDMMIGKVSLDTLKTMGLYSIFVFNINQKEDADGTNHTTTDYLPATMGLE